MAIHDVKVPQLSESVAEATLLQWKKKPGDAVAADEILIEIEREGQRVCVREGTYIYREEGYIYWGLLRISKSDNF